MAESKTSEHRMKCQFEIRSILNSKMCGKCEMQAISAFCQQCQQFICKECQGLHLKWKELRSHSIIKIEDDAEFQDALLSTQEVVLLIFSAIKQNLATIEEAFKWFDMRTTEIKDKEAEVETAINREVDAVIEKVKQRKVQLLMNLKQDTKGVLSKLDSERCQVEKIQKMFHTSLHTAISSFTHTEERKALMKSACDGVDNAKALLKEVPLRPTVKPYMTLVDMDDINRACCTFGRISNVALCVENSLASGDGLKFARIGQFIAVIVHPKDTEGDDYSEVIQVSAELIHCSTDTSDALCTVEMQSKSQYSITYKPLQIGKHSLNICINRNHIKDSPFAVSVHVTKEFFNSPEQCHSLSKLQQPTGLATDTKGNIVIVEHDAHCISIFSPDYKKMLSFGAQGSVQGQLNKPYGIAMDKDDNIFITDSGNNRVQKFSSSGQFIAEIGSKGSGEEQFRNPMGIAYNSHDMQLYVCDSDNCRVVILNTDLKWMDSFGIKGYKAGQFKYPCDIAFDHCGQIYVTEYYSNYRVQVFSSSKQHLKIVDTKNVSLGKLYDPYGIAFDSADTMYVTEVGNSSISIFDNCHNFVCCCGSKGSSVGKFSSPKAIHIDHKDKMYIVDTYNGRIQIYK